MIKFTLKCDQDHRFDSWFPSNGAFDTLKAGGHLACAVCGSPAVDKALMAPQVAVPEEKAPARPLAAPASPAEQALKAMREHVEKNATYVGGSFATEARAQHDGTSPERPIYGEARPEEAKKLIEDGVPVAPLPFGPSRKTN